MHCTNCGQRLTTDANFCGHCGQRIIPSDSASMSETVNDLVADKAKDIIIQEENDSFSNLIIDDVAKKASFIGSVNDSQVPNIHASIPQEEVPQYKITQETFLVDYLFRIERENTSTHNVSYRLLNTKTNKQSEWFDNISWLGNNLFGIEKDGKKGILDVTLQTCQLWNNFFEIKDSSYIAIYDYKKWGIIKNDNGIIRTVFSCQFDDLKCFNVSCIAICQNGKYGFMTYSADNIILAIPCVYEFIGTDFYIDAIITVKKDKKYGCLLYCNGQLFDSPCVFEKIDSYRVIPIKDKNTFVAYVLSNNNQWLYYDIIRSDLYKEKGYTKNSNGIQILLGLSSWALLSIGILLILGDSPFIGFILVILGILIFVGGVTILSKSSKYEYIKTIERSNIVGIEAEFEEVK